MAGGEGGSEYSSTISLTAALSIGGQSVARHCRFSLAQEPRYTLYTRVWVGHRFGLYGWEIFIPWNVQLQRVPVPSTLSRPPACASI